MTWMMAAAILCCQFWEVGATTIDDDAAAPADVVELCRKNDAGFMDAIIEIIIVKMLD